METTAAWFQARDDRASRLYCHTYNSFIMRAFITVALTRPYLDAVEWLLSGAARTRISSMPRDILMYVLEPYLWIQDSLCGIRHRNGFLYGVRNGPYIRMSGTKISHYRLGLPHRVGAPSYVENYDCIYYQDGRPYRESGPTHVSRKTCSYGINNGITFVKCDSETAHIIMRNRIGFRRLADGTTLIEIYYRKGVGPNSNYRSIVVLGSNIDLNMRKSKITITSDACVEVSRAVNDWMRDLDVASIVAAEWARAQRENAEH